MVKEFARGVIVTVIAISAVFPAADLAARSSDGTRASDGDGRYIVVFETPPLARHMSEARKAKLKTDSTRANPAWKLDASVPEAQGYLEQLDRDFDSFRAEASASLGRDLEVVHRYRYATNGFSASLSAGEARRMKSMPGVAKVIKDRKHRLHSDSGPRWIGADDIWSGLGGVPQSRGEGVVIAVIDSGINWDHPSFEDPGAAGHNHVNPYGQELGLCSDVNVNCNDKLVGVYDFVEDDPNTPETEEYANGFDNNNHGSLSASVAAGNPLTGNFNGKAINPSGVAPNANIISLRVCYTDDPDDSSDDACQNSAIIKAIDQAIADGVDVINYSIGSNTFSPWEDASAIAFLNAREAGIFVATSAGNNGPLESTMQSPGNAPWITAVGSATHDRLFTSVLNATQGGDTTPPGTFFGAGLSTQAVGPVTIVHAKDFGNALCGVGTEAPDVPDCGEDTGTNPFAPGTFNGEIVVCDRGIYGRIEKGNNVMMAGAGGYVLANTAAQGEQVNADEHCLASTHIGEEDGDALRAWLDTGSGHTASITGFDIAHIPELGDRLSGFSSRGPNLPPVDDIMKPNLIAPGQNILGAANENNDLLFANGTSFSSPHVAGAAALLKAVDPDLTPAMIMSMLETTATAEQAVDETGAPADPHERGAGRPRLGFAANAGLFLDETFANFIAADPAQGGDPRTLNLPSMMDNDCKGQCSFTRVVEPLVPGSTWTASAVGFPPGVVVDVTPQQFTLGSNASRSLQVNVDLGESEALGDWVYGLVRLSSPGLPDTDMPVVVFSTGGIVTDANSGYRDITLSDLPALPNATFTAGGLTAPRESRELLVEDPTWEDPFDGGLGVFTELHTVPAGALWLHARTLASDSEDVDLFVGMDRNGDGLAQEDELICESTTPDDLELCDIFTPEAGQWWVLAQNWEDGFENNGPQQEVILISGVVSDGKSDTLTATGPGIVGAGEAFKLRVSWNDINALDGQELLGAVGIGDSAATPNNIEVIPVTFERSGIEEPKTTPLFQGRQAKFALAPNQIHERLFMDVPPGATELEVKVKGRTTAQTDNLEIVVWRVVTYDVAFGEAPFVPPLGDLILPSPTQALRIDVNSVVENGNQVVRISGSDLEPGRHYISIGNNFTKAVPVTVEADLAWGANVIPMLGGLYEPVSRPDIKQGFEYNEGANSRAVIWFTFGEDGEPAWFLSSGGKQEGNVWTGDLLRFTNDGTNQQSTQVGAVSMTLLDTQDVVFNWTLFGESGTERTKPISPFPCPEVGGEKVSYTGQWYPGFDGKGGSTVLVNANFQAQVHYVYDDSGVPRWIFSSGALTNSELPLLQWRGFCPTCSGPTSNQVVGLIEATYDSETTGTTTLDYVLAPPLSGDVNRTDSTVKLTSSLACP